MRGSPPAVTSRRASASSTFRIRIGRRKSPTISRPRCPDRFPARITRHVPARSAPPTGRPRTSDGCGAARRPNCGSPARTTDSRSSASQTRWRRSASRWSGATRSAIFPELRAGARVRHRRDDCATAGRPVRRRSHANRAARRQVQKPFRSRFATAASSRRRPSSTPLKAMS